MSLTAKKMHRTGS